MPQLGILGSRLAQAAERSNSSVASIITAQKNSIETERPARLQKVVDNTKRPQKRFQKKRQPQRRKNSSQNQPPKSPQNI
ncbi:hypothetical protein CSA56_15140 [candidate division KSB3 bacterium]|uniref:Uncharacterized protein n=1 Tax=candidate division KSB3 bacterium TaxID=2044937 RepID=A0A2G6K9Z7_9BACT|nr:MAG: hypothetical protein CSA56_15140 [candidate division KSB3 bacterium]